MAFSNISTESLKKKIDEVRRFLSVSLRIANAHTVDFYTRDVWRAFMAVDPEEVLAAVHSAHDRTGAPEVNTSFGFCDVSKKLVDVSALLRAAEAHSLPGLGVCVQRQTLMDTLRVKGGDTQDGLSDGPLLPDEFMNSKKAHEVPAMAEVVAALSRCCKVKQVIDVGSGKGYLCSFLSMQYNLQVFGIDCSSTNTRGAQERNRKLKKFSRAYQKHGQSKSNQEVPDKETGDREENDDEREGRMQGHHRPRLSHEQEEEEDGAKEREMKKHVTIDRNNHVAEVQCSSSPDLDKDALSASSGPTNADLENLFFTELAPDIVEQASPRIPPSQLSAEERERRKRENLERKARNGKGNSDTKNLYSPLTSYVTAETELRTLITELEDAVMVGLHTCGDLAPSTLRMFEAKQELRAVCSVGCCYHLLSEEFDEDAQECESGVYGFPMSQYLREQACFCGRNARMSACLALERVSFGGGLPMESLFYRAVLHVILQDHYDAHKSEKRVGNVYSKASSFVDYVRRALRKLELDESKLTDSVIQSYHDLYISRMNEMVAFNLLKVSLAPCIEGLILLDRLCYLKEQENVSYSALVQLFNPLLSPRCYAIVGIKGPGIL
ncbi:methyltransferase-like protein 25 [Pangasianodon hypophthalmus]|uniref:methyltransferase-like protein 25 n=1 Tax=Pangasianodon hypophthalmus TaxID=310915 RepID=UPI000EFF60AB|nr:methyltransferase-like protein 25 [Pangasianodon hypophthalmus]